MPAPARPSCSSIRGPHQEIACGREGVDARRGGGLAKVDRFPLQPGPVRLPVRHRVRSRHRLLRRPARCAAHEESRRQGVRHLQPGRQANRLRSRRQYLLGRCREGRGETTYVTMAAAKFSTARATGFTRRRSSSATDEAYWWSPDGKRIAFLRFDDAPVKRFNIVNLRPLNGSLEAYPYPKVGDPEPARENGCGRGRWRETGIP